MRVLQIYRDLGWGGIQNHVLSLSQGLIDTGVEVVFAGPCDSWLTINLKALGVECLHLPIRGLYDLRSHIRLGRLIRAHGIDILHSHGRRATFYAANASRLTSTPHVASAHSTNSWKSFTRPGRVIAISNAVHEALVAHGVNSEQLRTVYHGAFDLDRMAPLSRNDRRKQLNLADTDIAIAMSGRFIRDKGHDLLIKAVHRLGKRAANTHLFLIGADKSQWCGQLHALIASLRLADNVRLIPYQEDVLPWLVAMDIMVVPSRREGLSLSLLEAASCGLAIIGSEVGGIPEVIDDDVTGLLFQSDDIDGLARCVDALTNDQERRRRLGNGAVLLVKKKFSVASMTRNTKSVYSEILP